MAAVCAKAGGASRISCSRRIRKVLIVQCGCCSERKLNMCSRYYPNVEIDVPQLTVELRNLFDSEYEVQTFQVSTTSIVQARKSNPLRDLTGLSSARSEEHTSELQSH